MILKNISVLYGNNLKFIEKTNVLITNNTFKKINPKIKSTKNKVVNCDGLLTDSILFYLVLWNELECLIIPFA